MKLHKSSQQLLCVLYSQQNFGFELVHGYSVVHIEGTVEKISVGCITKLDIPV